MAIEYVNGSTARTTGDTTSLSCALPSGVQNGDLVIASVQTDRLGGSALQVAPDGWEQETFFDDGDPFYMQNRVYRHWVNNESGSYQWSIAVAGGIAISMTAWKGVDPDTPIEATHVSTDSTLNTTFQASGITTLSDNAVVIICYGINDGASVNVQPVTAHAAMTKRNEVSTTTSVFGHSIMQASELIATAGAQGARNATSGGPTRRNIALHLSLKEAPPSPPPVSGEVTYLFTGVM